MEFYKKMVKTKETSVLTEKEYKCASLQAITNEAIKENNKKRLKELVEEINGHLADLRAFKDDKTTKGNNEKCHKLIATFEDCLVKIVNNNSMDVLAMINGQLEELEDTTNKAIGDNNLEELKRLAERMERNVAVVKEIPEIKSARSSVNGDERTLEAVNKYTSLINKVLTHINAANKPTISGPLGLEGNQEDTEGNRQQGKQKPPNPVALPPKPNKIGLNEVEEKLKLMRQKRLNRLSTFVDQQTKLAEQRSLENYPKNSTVPNESFENPSRVPDKLKREKSSPEIKLPGSHYKGLEKFGGQKVSVRHEENKELGKIEEKPLLSEFVSGLRNSFGKGGKSRSSAEIDGNNFN